MGGRGSSRIYFRKAEENELVTIALVPEDRKEVKKEFFKEKPKDETIEQEAKRYKKVENFIYHIQIEMNVPAPPARDIVWDDGGEAMECGCYAITDEEYEEYDDGE